MDWTGKRVRLYFDDMGKVLMKVGTITSADEVYTEIKTIRGSEIIPTVKVVRMEVLG